MANSETSLEGKPALDRAGTRTRRSEDYREARDEYAAISELRKKNWIAARTKATEQAHRLFVALESS